MMIQEVNISFSILIVSTLYCYDLQLKYRSETITIEKLPESLYDSFPFRLSTLQTRRKSTADLCLKTYVKVTLFKNEI